MTIKHFNDISKRELYDIVNLRESVFVVEQECYYLDADYKDLESYHLLKYSQGKLIAYLRILPKGLSFDCPSIGRVIVRMENRKDKLGSEIMSSAIDFVRQNFNSKCIKIASAM